MRFFTIKLQFVIIMCFQSGVIPFFNRIIGNDIIDQIMIYMYTLRLLVQLQK